MLVGIYVYLTDADILSIHFKEGEKHFIYFMVAVCIRSIKPYFLQLIDLGSEESRLLAIHVAGYS